MWLFYIFFMFFVDVINNIKKLYILLIRNYVLETSLCLGLTCCIFGLYVVYKFKKTGKNINTVRNPITRCI